MKQCQSCGMPLRTKKAGDCRGTERDASKSDKWCSLCYADGKFITPNMSLSEMTRIVDDAVRLDLGWRRWHVLEHVVARR